jgi:hypothetical protein
MHEGSFTTSFVVDQNRDEVYDAVVDVRSWWFGDIEGSSAHLGDEFSYSVPGTHWNAMRVTELVRGERVAWLVTDSRLEFTDVPDEWTGTTIAFDIEPADTGTRLRFTHVGLVPALQCFTDCSSGWGHFVAGSLRTRIVTGAPAGP